MTRLILQDQAAGLRNLTSFRAPDSARVITIAGGTARIGKTSIVVNLATALAQNGQPVLLIDFTRPEKYYRTISHARNSCIKQAEST